MLFLVAFLVLAFLSTDASEENIALENAHKKTHIGEIIPEDVSIDKATTIAGKLLENLLSDPTTSGPRVSQPIGDLGQVGGTSSKNGIACHIYASAGLTNSAINKVQYYQIKNSTLISSQATIDLPHLSHKNAMHHCGVSSDDQYLYALYTTETFSSSNHQIKLTFSLFKMHTQKVKNIEIVFNFEGVEYSHLTYTEGVKHSSIAYDEKTQEFLLFFPRYGQKSSIFVFCRFDNDKPTLRAVDNNQIKTINAPLQWQYIDNSLIATASGKYFIYEPSSTHIISNNMRYDAASKTITYAYNLGTETTPPIIVLKPKKINLGTMTPIDVVYLASFIPNYQEILNNKIIAMEPSFTDKSSGLSFDPSRLRYLGCSQSGLFIGHVSIVGIFSQALVDALKIINQKWQLSIRPDAPPYVNILYDAWYIYHAEKQTDQFFNLQETSPILQKVSPELKKIYPLLNASQKTEARKKRTKKEEALAGQPGTLGSSWKPTNFSNAFQRTFRTLQQNLGSFYVTAPRYAQRLGVPFFVAGAIFWGLPYYLLSKYRSSVSDLIFKRR